MAVGIFEAASRAKLGPERATGIAPGMTSRVMPHMVRPESNSMPLVALTRMPRLDGVSPHHRERFLAVARKAFEGTAITTHSASRIALARSGWNSISFGNVTPGSDS